ncbi:hypothetical protein O181_072488, partial [Austropuccinia psidii MF-1]|nr:hypothetical protein [Austropuccinia psidii MF-1]
CVTGDGSGEGTTYSCAISSCTKVHFDKCYGVTKGIRGLEPNFSITVPPFGLHSYRVIGYSKYVEAYVGTTSPSGYGGSPQAICETPIPHT